ncbi:MAG: prephenate dehydrogenase/arogenate dehydrogenase family protein [Gammaproteobacteria bacterium]|nr:prephenate dehydrogenase/arogenate dehydrogenase family protein [Gammaproteobacteria bacterium]MBU1603039.1 prephenate dehydrogenase/arogenate dehydrogenase family protein [Gammaproteobacteria bacterium]MBU2432071.1 prephenate dehydrogenase/arogenate dehydrogenase family protein [Gammaproteobacteria bacterium]MBU2448038.1 prephenate dehydrogenase/arogenate dehydrogenase family protein [Gammaproteobacteria bacterium]
MAEFGKVVVFGTGLIGGSFSLALKEADAVEEVVGFGRTPATLRKAQELGVIDRAGINPTHEIEDADIVLVATPVAQMADIFERIAPYLGPHTIVTDGGSTKGDVVAAARAALGDRIGQFVPAHPIAGAENSGPAAARWDLYQGKKVVVTPLPENSDDALDHIKRAWSLCGADIYELTPEMHDRVFAAVSHLPHLLSYALVHQLAVRDDADLFFTFAASGFRDFTRIAASHPEMWRDICLANREALLGELDCYRAQLDELRTALARNDGERLEEVFGIARRARRDWAGEG